MLNQRYPPELLISLQDFHDSGWKEVLDQTLGKGYCYLGQDFSSAACKAVKDKHGKVLWLLADTCNMMLSPKSVNDPFKPYLVKDGQMTMIPDDLSESDIAFYAEIVDAIDDVWLKARIADLVWLKLLPRNVKFALAAIDAYRRIPLDAETWVYGGDECWMRAISLAYCLKTGAGTRLNEMEAAILDAFNATTKDRDFFVLGLANLLKDNRLGLTHSLAIAQKLKALAVEFDGDGNLFSSCEFFDAALCWFSIYGDKVKSVEMTVAVAEIWEKKALALVSYSMVAASYYEKAIQIYRSIPKNNRSTYQIDERIKELLRKMSNANKKSLEEFVEIKTPKLDITDLVENARKSVAGKPVQKALLSFVNIYQGVRVDEIRDRASKNLQNNPLASLLESQQLSRDGRVIAKQPAACFDNAKASEDPALWAEMVKYHLLLTGCAVKCYILPAHEVLLQEHRLREDYFIGLAKDSSIVPLGRERLFGKALYAGFDRDFTVSIHLLAPQIEHLVRFHLNNSGIKTTNPDKDGIENENGLSTLMSLPETATLFGKDLSFEIKALFCDANGPNLRNELAHGLLGDDSFPSVSAIYAWWFGLRLVFGSLPPTQKN